MNFSTSNKILGAIVLSGLATYLLISNNTHEVATKTIQSKNTPKDTLKQDNEVQILYLDTPKEEKKAPVVVQKAQKSVEEFYDEPQKISTYIKEKKLKQIIPSSPSQRFAVYADITQEEAEQKRDKTLPPPAPAVVQTTFASGIQYNGIISGDVLRSAGEIDIVDTNPDGTLRELTQFKQPQQNQEVSSQEESVIIAPPSIGQ